MTPAGSSVGARAAEMAATAASVTSAFRRCTFTEPPTGIRQVVLRDRHAAARGSVPVPEYDLADPGGWLGKGAPAECGRHAGSGGSHFRGSGSDGRSRGRHS